MKLYADKQIKAYMIYLSVFSILFLCIGLLLAYKQIESIKNIYITHDEAVASSLLEQGVSKEIIATALTNSEITENGNELLKRCGISYQTENKLLPFILKFQNTTICKTIVFSLCFIMLLFGGTMLFFYERKKLYIQAENILNNYINGDYSKHISQNDEGNIYAVFSRIDKLAEMLQSKNEAEYKAKVFLRNTIADISHQLKTPLAALTMYQEIIENEPDNLKTVQEFTYKIGLSIKRIEQLIQSMLKIARLDTDSILFEKRHYNIKEIICYSINELTTRAENEHKKILIDDSTELSVFCDMEWTSEAIGNIVKNALDHTEPGDQISISWENTPLMSQIFITDTGNGIAPEDIHHIFKRFYRSQSSLDTQGIGLGLSLAKLIIEGQGGTISVQSELNIGTTFTLSFLTKS